MISRVAKVSMGAKIWWAKFGTEFYQSNYRYSIVPMDQEKRSCRRTLRNHALFETGDGFARSKRLIPIIVKANSHCLTTTDMKSVFSWRLYET
ncbi:MAG: hypothetical protein D8M56_02905 [Chloroflexi bacterium]|nr:hypothetical protein [Chloroflexota bacterium]